MFSLNSQSDKVKHLIDHFFKLGVTNKRELYTKIVIKTGIPRSTIRRIAGDYKKQLVRKVKVLTDKETLKRLQTSPYTFIPESIRFIWHKKTQNDFSSIRCEICKKPVCYMDGIYESNIVCHDCKIKFPIGAKK